MRPPPVILLTSTIAGLWRYVVLADGVPAESDGPYDAAADAAVDAEEACRKVATGELVPLG